MSFESTRSSLLSRVRDPADHEAWRQFEGTYGRLLVRYAQARGMQRTDAEDVSQVVLMKLSKALRAFRYDKGRGRFRDYLGAAVRNEVNSLLSSPKAAATSVQEDAGAGESDPDLDAADAAWEREWMLHHFRVAMRTVRSTVDTRTLEMFDRLLQGDSPEAVAAAFGITRFAVYKAQHRVKEQLRELVRRQIHEEDLPR